MRIDLIEFLKREAVPEAQSQSSIYFKKSPQIIFVEDFERYTPILDYTQLKTLELNSEDKSIHQQEIAAIEKNPKLYNGNLFLFSGMQYDDEKNTLYIKAMKVDYALMRLLHKKEQASQLKRRYDGVVPEHLQQKFSNMLPDHSPLLAMPLFKTGVITPVITTDDQTVLMRRATTDTMLCSPAGSVDFKPFKSEYLQQPLLQVVLARAMTHKAAPKLTLDDLNQHDLRGIMPINTLFGNSLSDIFRVHAINELLEELLLDQDFRVRANLQEVRISSLSLHYGDGLKTLEFIVPVRVSCDSAQLASIVMSNMAPDRAEHTKEYYMVPLASVDRGLAQQFLQQQSTRDTTELYFPVILSSAASVVEEHRKSNTHPNALCRFMSRPGLHHSDARMLRYFSSIPFNLFSFPKSSSAVMKAEDKNSELVKNI